MKYNLEDDSSVYKIKVRKTKKYQIKEAKHRVERTNSLKKSSRNLCFNRASKSYLTISINAIYESSNFFSTDLIHPAIHSGLYFTPISLPSLGSTPFPFTHSVVPDGPLPLRAASPSISLPGNHRYCTSGTPILNTPLRLRSTASTRAACMY